MSRSIPAGFVLVAALALGVATTHSALGEDSKTIEFNRDIRPILSNNCYTCHGFDKNQRQAELRLDTEEGLLADRGGYAAVTPGDLEKSELIARVIATDDLQMPPADSGKSLTAEQIETLKLWVQQGAPYQGHWAFIPPQRPELPAVAHPERSINEIDRFVQAKLEANGLSLKEQADKTTLIRRVTLDLTGLPPTIEEVDAFLADDSPNAYETIVDRLLQSPHYGEHMARNWLDAARYGDTHGLHLDNYRSMWPYRDWVIDAFNDNKPFDEFTIEQLAGDLLPDPTTDQLVATGFNRCNVTTSEGGSIDEEYYVRYAVDRVDTTGTVWMGMTLGCAVCHDHKFDPVTQKEFYQLFGYFNSLTEKAMDKNAPLPPPTIKVPSPDDLEKGQQFADKTASLQTDLNNRAVAASDDQAAWEKQTIAQLDDQQVATENLVVHVPFDDAEGSQASDVTDPDRSGSVAGNAKWDTGRLAGCFEFDGNTHVDLGNVASFEKSNAFSYGAWIQPASNDGRAIIAKMDDSNGIRGYDMYLAGGKLYAHFIYNWPTSALRVTTKSAIDVKADSWHHVMVTYDGTEKAAGIKIYVDGKPQELEITHDNLDGTIVTDKPLHVGRRNPGAPFVGKIDDVRIYSTELSADEISILAESNPATPILATPAEERTPEQIAQLKEYYLNNHDETYKQLKADLENTNAARDEHEKTIPSTLVMEDMAERRQAHILVRGEYDNKGEPVEPGVPSFLPSLPEGAPPNRLALARWLVDPSHPLTARVTVNRYWQRFFGTGIVKTQEDFGSQGEWPTHPDLLDWLATEFIASGWDVKYMQKLIAMSATYRQTAIAEPELLARDPENRLLARGPRFRADAEVIRDSALFVSGLLHDKIGGESVKPYQPSGIWEAVAYTSSNTSKFEKDEGLKLYRRSMYTFWKRTAPPPSMITFDAPSRESCTVRRSRTNTPLQALVLMNDIQFFEAARMFGQQIMKNGGETPTDKIIFAFRLATSRKPGDEEVQILLDAYNQYLADYQQDSESAASLVTVGDAPRDQSLDIPELAAWTMISNMILNLNETLTKG